MRVSLDADERIETRAEGSRVMRTLYSILWIAWIAAFLTIELSAIFTGHHEYTLSDFVWRLEQVHRAWTFARFFIMAFCVWLMLHLAFGWFG